MIVPTEGKAWIQSNNYPTCLEGKGHLAAEVISNKDILEQNTPPKKRRRKVGGKKNPQEKEKRALWVKRSQWFWHVSSSTFRSLCLLPILATSQNF